MPSLDQPVSPIRTRLRKRVVVPEFSVPTPKRQHVQAPQVCFFAQNEVQKPPYYVLTFNGDAQLYVPKRLAEMSSLVTASVKDDVAIIPTVWLCRKSLSTVNLRYIQGVFERAVCHNTDKMNIIDVYQTLQVTRYFNLVSFQTTVIQYYWALYQLVASQLDAVCSGENEDVRFPSGNVDACIAKLASLETFADATHAVLYLTGEIPDHRKALFTKYVQALSKDQFDKMCTQPIVLSLWNEFLFDAGKTATKRSGANY